MFEKENILENTLITKETKVMKRIYAIVAALLIVCAASAQNSKFGKPTQEEWELKSVSFAPDADAVVLYKSVEVNYTLSGAFSAMSSGGEGSLDDDSFSAMGRNKYISPENTTMVYDVKVRIKVLKDSGTGYTAMDIISFSDKTDMNMRDEFYEMSVMVLSNVDGKVKKKRVSASNFKDERIDEHYSIRHIRVPDVKAGDIVEYQYKLFSLRSTFIFDTQLQEGIPVMYAKCMMDIPFFLQFNVNKPEIPNVTAGVTLGQVLIKSPNNDSQMPRKVNTNVYTIEARDLPAYDGTIDLKNLTEGKVYCVRTELKDKRYDVIPDASGPVRHMIIGK